MTFKPITIDKGEYVKPAELQPNTVIHGTFIETFVNPTNQAVSHKIKLFGSDREILLSGAAQLNILMSKVRPGSEVKIKYVGKQPSPVGKWKGAASHQFEVSVKEESKTLFTEEEIAF